MKTWSQLIVCFFVLTLTSCTSTSRQPSVARIQNLVLKPMPNDALSADDQFTASFTYEINVLHAGNQYFATVMFEQQREGRTMSAPYPEGFQQLRTPSGTVQLSASIAKVLLLPGIAKPLRIWIYINEQSGSSGSPIATAGPFEYKVRQ